MPGAERHVLSVQMSSLCRHNESYKHKYASRQAEKVIRSQIVLRKYPITKKVIPHWKGQYQIH